MECALEPVFDSLVEGSAALSWTDKVSDVAMIRWIASYPKSGNTWVRLFLMAYEAGDKFDMNAASHGFYWDINPALYQKLAPAPLEELSAAEILALRPAALLYLSRVHNGHPIIKTHVANMTVNGEIKLIPRSVTDRVLYLLRDPRDVAVSYANHRNGEIDTTIAFMANPNAVRRSGHVPSFISDWSRHVQSFKKTEFPCLTVRYEDMLATPADSFAAILDFFGIACDSARLEQAIAATRFDALSERESTDGYIGRHPSRGPFFRRGQVGGWREDLSPEQVAAIESVHGAEMVRAGYALASSATAHAAG